MISSRIVIAVCAALCICCAGAVVQQGKSFPEGVVLGSQSASPEPGTLIVTGASRSILQVYTSNDEWETVASASSSSGGTDIERLERIEALLQPAQLQSNLFCSGGGTFIPGPTFAEGSCQCFQSASEGFYVGSRCETCDIGFDRDSSTNKCTDDVEPPTLTLASTDNVIIPVGSNLSLVGATAVDNKDGDITNQIVIVGNVNTSIIGEYTVNFTVADAAGNEAMQTISIGVVPETIRSCWDYKSERPGAFSGSYSLDLSTGGAPDVEEVYCLMDDEYEGGGWTLVFSQISDSYTTILSQSVSSLTDIKTDGALTRIHDFLQRSSEIMSISGENASPPMTPFLWAQLDGAAYSSLLSSGTIGTMPVHYPKGVMSTVSTVIEVSSAYHWGHRLHTGNDDLPSIYPTSAGNWHLCWTDTLSSFKDRPFAGNHIESSTTPAFCEAYDPPYSFPSGQSGRNINTFDYFTLVRWVNGPTIAVTGGSAAIVAGSAYTDAGATATDLDDGDLTSSIVVTSNLNENVPGDYEVTYTVTDSHGHSATATRAVQVYITDCYAYKQVNSSAPSQSYPLSLTGNPADIVNTYCVMDQGLEGDGWAVIMNEVDAGYTSLLTRNLGSVSDLTTDGSSSRVFEFLSAANEIMYVDTAMTPFLWAQFNGAEYATKIQGGSTQTMEVHYPKGPLNAAATVRIELQTKFHWGHRVAFNLDDIHTLPQYSSGGWHLCWVDTALSDRPFAGDHIGSSVSPAACPGYSPEYTFPPTSGRNNARFDYHILVRNVPV